LLPFGLLALMLVLAACADNGNGTADDDVATDDTAVEDVTDDTTTDDEAVEDDDTVEIGGADLDGPITFGDYGWDSAIVLNRIAQYILEEGYGYETDSIFGETIPLFQGLLSGDLDVSMEIWAEQQPGWQPALDDGQLLDLGTSFGESVQGWWVPTYVIEGDEERGIEPVAPDLRHVNDLPEYKDLFTDPEDPSKGRFYECIAGWECERVNEIKFEVYGLDEHFNRFLPGSGAALATSLVSAYERGEPWVGYYWGPTWIFGQLDLTMLEEPPHTEECWDGIVEAMEGGPLPDEVCAYSAVAVHIAVTTEFAERAPDVVTFLENFRLTMEDVSEALAYMFEEDVEAEDAALWFLREREELWVDWVPEEVAERVQTSLSEE
jgi:glycine betaine/proline transport system substrate-binding protein